MIGYRWVTREEAEAIFPPRERMLGRTFDHLTQAWIAPGLTPIPAEVMDRIREPGATMADLVHVLNTRDRIAAERKS